MKNENWEKEFDDWFTQYRSDEDRDYWVLEEPLKAFISSLLTTAKEEGLNEGLSTANKGKLYNLVLEKGAQGERNRIIKLAKGMRIRCESDIPVRLCGVCIRNQTLTDLLPLLSAPQETAEN